jgi:hypothetical protein
MSEIRKLPFPTGDRMETGPLQIGEDWPGIFIRGDEAIGLALRIDFHLAAHPNCEIYKILDSLADLLDSCNVGHSQRRKKGPTP